MKKDPFLSADQSGIQSNGAVEWGTNLTSPQPLQYISNDIRWGAQRGESSETVIENLPAIAHVTNLSRQTRPVRSRGHSRCSFGRRRRALLGSTALACLVLSGAAPELRAEAFYYDGSLDFPNPAPGAIINIGSGDQVFFVPTDLPPAPYGDAGNATINNHGTLRFFEFTTANSATINNYGRTYFEGADVETYPGATAANATIINNGGQTYFWSASFDGQARNSNPANARLINNGAGSLFDFSGTWGPNLGGQITAGSIAGDGTFELGLYTLTVGGNNDSTTVSGAINGGSGACLIKIGTGTLTLTGVSSYGSVTAVDGGALKISGGGSLSNGQGVIDSRADPKVAGTVDGPGSTWTNNRGLDVYAGPLTISNGGKVSAGLATVSTSGGSVPAVINIGAAQGDAAAAPGTLDAPTVRLGESGSLVFNHTGTNYVFASQIIDWTTTHQIPTIKQLAGRTVLTGANTYTGVTSVAGGTLAVAATGSISGSKSIDVSGGATFDVSALAGGFTLGSTQSLTGGVGTNAGLIVGNLTANTGATVAPGLGAGNRGALSISNGLSLHSGSHLALDLAGTAAGTGYDQVVIAGGNISLAGDLAGSTLTFTPKISDVFYIILNNGAGTTNGTLASVSEGGSLFIGTQEFRISYTSDFGGAGFKVGGSGNDVALMAIPEPGSAAALLVGLGVLVGPRRRKYQPVVG